MMKGINLPRIILRSFCAYLKWSYPKLFSTFVLITILSIPVINAQTNQWQVLTNKNTGLPSGPRELQLYEDGTLYIATKRGVTKFDGQTWQSWNYNNSSIPIETIESMVVKNGNIYIGNSNSASDAHFGFYNNGEWASYSTDNSAIPSISVRDINITSDGIVYAATTKGVGIFDGEQWSSFDAEWPIGYHADFIEIDNNNNVYAITYAIAWNANSFLRIYKNSGSGFVEFAEVPDLPFNYPQDCLLDDNGNFWFAIGKLGLAKFDGDEFTYYNIDNSDIPLEGSSEYDQGEVKSLDLDSEGNLWIGTSKNYYSIIKFDMNNTFEPFIVDTTVFIGVGDTKDISAQEILIENNTCVWIATDTHTGLYKFNPSTKSSERYYEDNTGLPSNEIKEITFDSRGHIWMTGRNGFTEYDGEIFNTFSELNFEEKFPDLYVDIVHDIAVNKQGEVWAGFGSHLLHFKDNTWDTVNVSCGIVELDNDGVLWGAVPFYSQVFSFDGNEWTYYTSELAGGYINTIKVDKNNNVWIGSQYGLTKYDGNEWITFNNSDGLTGNNIKDIYINPSNNDLWLVTDYPNNGISHFNGSEWESFNSANSNLPGDQNISAVAVDNNNVVYAGFNFPRSSAFAKYENESWTVLDTSIVPEKYNNYALGYVNDIEIDANNNIWFATNMYGVFIYNENGVVVDVEENLDVVPQYFILHQNYPNPFNPTTSIEYQLVDAEKVSLKVYDVLGREVKTLVNEEKLPGNYSVTFDASNLSSGIYFYRMQSGKFIDTKKMILLK